MTHRQLIVARIEGYDVSNILLGGKTIFIPPERRESIQTEYSVGKIVTAMAVDGALIDIETTRGPELDKFLKGEETRRSGKSKTAAEKITAAEKEQHINPGSKVTINPILINDSFRELPKPQYQDKLCPITKEECKRADCRKFVSCWFEEITSMKTHGLEYLAAATLKEFKYHLGVQ